MSDFRWTFEKDQVQDRKRQQRALSSRRILFITALGLLAIAFTAGGIKLWFDKAEQRAKEELLADATFIFEKAWQHDSEILSLFLAGDQHDWKQGQLEAIARGGLVGREGFGLYALHAAPEVVDIHIDRESNVAELKGRVKYRVGLDEEAETITLDRVDFFVRDELGIWRYTAPPTSFWKGTGVSQAGAIQLQHPEGDTEISRRLIGEMDKALDALCDDALGYDCPRGMRLDIEFSTDPQTLATSAFPPDGLSASPIRLPAPSLVGYPADEKAMEVLSRGYVRRALIPLMAQLSGYD
ncbi:MAG: hypothetical protein GY759_23305 [Chloroflexi bacterium]|nr:hypothetical protein [Chloroflexota bacterium]